MAGGPNAGFAAALGEGYYKDAGLDVTIVQGNGSGNTAQLVANGRAQLAYADAVAVSQLIAKGAPMKVVSTIYQSNPNEVMALKKTGIKSVKDLKGKKVGVPVGLVADDDAAAVPQGEQPQGNRHDAAQHAAGVHGAGAAAGPGRRDPRLDGRLPDPGSRRRARSSTPIRFADYGVPTVSTSIFASQQLPQGATRTCVKKFIAASLKGWSFALDHPEQAVKDLKQVFPEVNEKLAAAELAAITPLFCSGGAKYIGKAEDAHWTRSQDLLAEVKLLPAGRIRRATTPTTTCRRLADCVACK